MKTHRIILATLTLALAFAGIVHAQTVPYMINYQGVITSGGETFDGTGYFKFALVNAAGDTTYWSNDGTSLDGLEPTDAVELAVADGLFMVMLGDLSLTHMMQDLTPYTFDGVDDAHLRIWFSEDNVTFTQLSPDQPLASAPYAMMAGRVPFGAIGENQIANSAITVHKIENGAVTANKLAANSVTGVKIENDTITSNKLDWATMPPTPAPLLGYAENGTFATAPVASGVNAIALGFGARAEGDYATVGGGYINTASDDYATVGGGWDNTASYYAATVGGGEDNTASDWYATVGGGMANTASNNYATVGGGYVNTASADYATVGGGWQNTASGSRATVGGGSYNVIGVGATNAVIAGGRSNVASAVYASVGGGEDNTASYDYATVGGGYTNTAGYAATVGGGMANTASGGRSTVGGGWQNTASGSRATIGGGVANTASDDYATVGGGWDNTASGSRSTVGGGRQNTASDWYATVGGGMANTASNSYATVGGGEDNTASGWYTTVGGGMANTASGSRSTVGGGEDNTASGGYATIPGGRSNSATDYAFAAGLRAKANHEGTFVWADSTDADFASVSSNTFLIRAGGGVGINTNNPGVHGGAMLAIATPSTNVPAIRLLGPEGNFNYGARLNFGDGALVYLEEDRDDRLVIFGSGRTAMLGGNVGINTREPSFRLHVEGTAGKTGGGSWSDSSDARLKTDVQEIGGALARLTQLRGVTFEWIHPDQHGRAPGEREAGLIAQEVEAVFPEWVSEGPVHGADAELIGEDGQMKSLSFPHSFNAYVIEAFKELQAENEALKARLARLEALLAP